MKHRLLYTLLALVITIKAQSNHQLSSSISKKIKNVEQLYLKRKTFDAEKSQRIDKLKEELKTNKKPNKEKYNLYKKLYKEYFSYKNAEAYQCILAMEKISQNIADKNINTETQLLKSEILLSSGLFKESIDIINKINIPFDSDLELEYYKLATRLYGDLKSYNDLSLYEKEYDRLNHIYSDSLLLVVDSNSIDFLMTSTYRLKNNEEIEKAITKCNKTLLDTSLTEHQKAMLYSCMAWCSEQTKDIEQQIRYLLKSIEFDIRSSTYETTSSRLLAQLLLNNNEIELAHKFAVHAIEDAEFYGALQRKAEITPIIPIIEKQLLELQKFKTTAILGITLFILISLFVIVFLWIRLFKQHSKLKLAQLHIKKKNNLLSEQNSKLTESNFIKEEYLTNYFELSTVYFHEIENMQNKIKSLLLQKKYTAIEKFLNDSGPKEDKERMFERFDKLFLNLFPNFLLEINKILNEPISEDDMDRLSSEMRVFALNRLGITNTDRIASILGVSRNTIYTYRNRIKSKSDLKPEEFDEYILGTKAN